MGDWSVSHQPHLLPRTFQFRLGLDYHRNPSQFKFFSMGQQTRDRRSSRHVCRPLQCHSFPFPLHGAWPIFAGQMTLGRCSGHHHLASLPPALPACHDSTSSWIMMTLGWLWNHVPTTHTHNPASEANQVSWRHTDDGRKNMWGVGIQLELIYSWVGLY